MAKVKLTKEQMEQIDSYSQSIKTLDGLVKQVRKRPGMYIGPVGNAGYLNMIREIFQNSIDQLVDKNSPCTWIKISMNEKTKIVTVEDNGLGIPFPDMIRIFTERHTSRNFEKKPGEYSSGLNGVGAKVTNALSKVFAVESYHYSGVAKRLELKDGYVSKKPFDIKSEKGKQGSKVEFSPEESVMGNLDLHWEVVYRLVKLILSLTDIGSVVYFEAINMNGEKYTEKMVNEDGILTDLIMKTTSPIIKPITFSYDTGYMKSDIAICWASSSEKLLDAQGFAVPYSITTFSNWCPTRNEGSTHFEGFMDGISAWFTNYMNKFYLSDKSKIKVVKNDVFEQLCAMVSVAHLDPQFIGQSKDILSNSDMRPFIKDCVVNGLENWAKENPQDLQRVCKWIKEVATFRMKSDDLKVKVIVKEKSKLTGMPTKYEPPTGKNNNELLIVEGDSAGGQTKTARDKQRQGVFPIRGKIINPFGNSMQKVMNNEEIKGLITIIGAGYGRNFDIRKVKFDKIIFMADADPDGDHIASLLLRVFLIIFPGLIESGKVYKCIPPLFGLHKGSGKSAKIEYFIERAEYLKYKQELFTKTNSVCDINGDKISSKEMMDILYANEDYIYEIDKVKDNYSLDPVFLEVTLKDYIDNHTINSKKLIADIMKRYRFVDTNYDKKSNTLVMEGLIGNKINTMYLNERFISECDRIINIIKANKRFMFLLNGTPATMYQLLQDFENSSAGNNLSRYKGLGEMEPDQLRDSCLSPDRNRLLMRYTTNDIKEDIEVIRRYESDKTKILEHIGVVKRTDLLG